MLDSNSNDHDQNYTSNLLIGILMPEKMLCFTPHKQFSSTSIVSLSFTITLKKTVKANGPLLFFFQHMFSICPMPK